jgi:hypothetical protein
MGDENFQVIEITLTYDVCLAIDSVARAMYVQ